MRHRFLAVAFLLISAAAARAHFVFAVPQPGNAKAQLFISETLTPASEVDIETIRNAKLRLRDAAGNEADLQLVRTRYAFEVALPGQGNRLIYGIADLGLQTRDPKKPHILVYYPKSILGDAFHPKSTVGEKAPVEMIPAGKPGSVMLKFLAHGKPQPNAEITVLLPDGSEKKVKTDAHGVTEPFPQAGRYGAWARFWEPVGGERDGKRFEETRRYATLVFEIPASLSPAIASRGSATAVTRLPEAASSFGSVESGNFLYVYGGHIAKTHSYSTAAVSGRFHRVNLSGAPVWEELPAGRPLQGMNLAAFDGKIYLIGGMAPRNKPGEPADNRSIADCARFDPKTKTWEALPPMPEPRSSHDVVVIDGKLIVTGGWALRGKENQWATSLVVLDLSSPKLEWKSVDQPFKRRALMAAAYQGKMYVVGGFDEKNRIVRNVSIYDPKTSTWTEGTRLPAGPGLSFAPAAGVHEKDLYVSVSDGTLLKLSRTTSEWEKVGDASPRLAHRLAAAGPAIWVIGGATEGDNLDSIEAISISR